MDLHTANMLRLIKKASTSFHKTETHQIPGPTGGAQPDLPTQFIPFGGGISIPREDEHVAGRPWVVRKYMEGNNRFAPFKDEPDAWSDPREARQALAETFGPLLPEPDVTWGDAASDTTLERWVFQGIAAQNLQRVTEPNAPEQGGFVVRMEPMAALPVRPGLAPYGGDAYFTREGRVSRIHLGGTDVRPGDPGWARARFVFRTSSFVWATLADHVGRCHLGISNTVALSSRRTLGASHALRRILAPNLFRTAAINAGATLSLMPWGGLVHRAASLTWQGMESAFNLALASWSPERFDDELRRKGVHPSMLDDPEVYPYGRDGADYWNLVAAYVEKLVNTCPGLSVQDAGVRAMWTDVRRRYPRLQELSPDALRDFLATFVFTVTGYHSHVGTVAAYVRDPAMAGGRLWPQGAIADKQNTIQLSTIACITGFPLPTIDGDFSHLMPDEPARAAAAQFRDELRKFQAVLDERNKKRAQAFVSFSPNRVATSVGI